MKLKKLLCTVLASAVLMTGTAVMADETAASTIKLEGEYFNLSLDGTATTPTSNNLFHKETKASNDYTMYYLGTEQPEYEAEFYAEEAGTYTMQYLTNLYATTAAETWRTQYKFTLNGTDYDGSLATKLSATPALGVEFATYEISVYLNKGLNTLKFTGTTKCTDEANKDRYLLELDYVQFTKVTSYELVIEGENATETNLSGGKENCADASSGKLQFNGVKNFPAYYTYKTTVATPGIYDMSYVLAANVNQQTWLGPLSVTVTQGDKTLIDNEVITSTGSYQLADDAEARSCGKSVDGGTLVYNFAGHNFYEYNRLNTVELEEGEITVTINVIGFSKGDNPNVAYVGIDCIKLTKVGDIEVYEKSAKVVIEGENPTTKTNTSMDAVNADKASGGAIGIGATTNLPAYATYNATVDYDGDYNLEFVLWLYEAAHIAPVAVTVKQGDDVIIDDKVISTTGTYTLQEYDADMEEWATQEATTCDVTAKKGSLSATYAGYDVNNFIWKNKVPLKAGNVEVTMRYVGFPYGNTTMFMGIDAITFARDIDYSAVQIKADTEEILDGSTLQLAVADTCGSAIEASDEVGDVTTISWTSSNNNILSVDENGLLTTVNPGIATVTATVEHNGSAATAEKTFTVMTENEQFVIKSCTLDGNDVVVKYMAKGDISENKITLIAGRFPTSAANTSLAEVKKAEITGNAPSMYRTARITLDDTTGKIKLFSWKDLDTIAPVFSAIEVN